MFSCFDSCQILSRFYMNIYPLMTCCWSYLEAYYTNYFSTTKRIRQQAKVEQELCSYLKIFHHKFFWKNSFSTCTGQIWCPLLNVLSLYVGSDKVIRSGYVVPWLSYVTVHSFETHKFYYQLVHKPSFYTSTCFGHLLYPLYIGKS